MADTIVGAHREPPQAPNQEVGLNCCRSHQSNKTPKTESHIPCSERKRNTTERKDRPQKEMRTTQKETEGL